MQRQAREYQQLLARKQKDVPGATAITFWEQNYYSELVKKSDYDFDSQSMRPYFPYAEVKQGVLDFTEKLFGVEIRRVKDAPVWDPSVECYEMYEGGKLVGRFYLDMHPRDEQVQPRGPVRHPDGRRGRADSGGCPDLQLSGR